MMAYEGRASPQIGLFIKDLYRNQGFWGFYKGIEANIMRAMVMNATMMSVYEQAKYTVKYKLGVPDGLKL